MGKLLVVILLLHLYDQATSDSTKTLSGVPYKLSGDSGFGVRRIEYVTVTVDDLDTSARFYGTVLGGYEIEFCQDDDILNNYCTENGFVRYSGDIHNMAMFDLDLSAGVPTPDISSSGDYEVLSKFFIIGNSIIQLVQFSRLIDGSAYHLRNNMTSPCWMANAHLDFWIEDTIDANDFIADVESRAFALGKGGVDVKFNRPVPQETREDRESIPKSQYANKVVGGPFDGLAWAYFKGPVGEQLEIYQIDRTIKKGIGAAYCSRGAVSTGFVDTALITSNTSKYGWGGGATCQNGCKTSKNSTSQQLHGMFQYGFRTSNLHRATGFYTEVLGGDLIAYPTQGIEIMLDDSAHWMILNNETIEAYEYADSTGLSREAAMEIFGVANLSSTGHHRLDHRFILFDNFVVEPLQYTRGLTFGGEGFDPEYNHTSSPAYLGTITASFGIDVSDDIPSLSAYISYLQDRLVSQGYLGVVLPPSIASFPADHPYGGLEYGFMKGPDSEAIALVYAGSSSSRFKMSLHAALLASGGVSTMFNDTDPYEAGDMGTFCPYALYEGPYGYLEAASTSSSTCEYHKETEKHHISPLEITLLVISCVSLSMIAILVALFFHLQQAVRGLSTNSQKSTELRAPSASTKSPLL
jgi:catechol 2,3-dioxygenase-like lactoylglutathione lyase family enzyme